MDTDKDISELLGKLLEVANGLSRFQRGVSERALDRDFSLAAGLDSEAPRAGLTAIARQLLEEIDVRGRYLPGVADHCWPMLLDLYVQAVEHRQVSVSAACIAARAANTTALRWIGGLIEQGVIERSPDPTDRRRFHVTLAPRTLARVSHYLAHVGDIEGVVAPADHEKPRRLQA